jgi:hypothetical protein
MSHMHPEFGYFSPSPRLRRNLRLTLLALAFGATIGSVTVGVLRTDRNAQPATGAPIQYAEISSMYKPPDMATRSDYRIEIGLRTADPAPGPSMVDSDTAGTNLTPRESQPPLNPQVHCITDNAHVHCMNENPRPPRLRSAANSPEIARLPLGRPTALVQASQTPADRASEEPTPFHNALAPAISAELPASEDAGGNCPRFGPESRKQSYRVGGAQKSQHRKSRVATDRRNWDNRFGGLGRAYAFDSAYRRTGFWYWSW